MAKEYSMVVEQPGTMVLKQFDIPNIGMAGALLRIEMTGICATDPKIYYGKISIKAYPVILGHEMVGHIEEIGEEAENKFGVKRGDRVIVESIASCGYCRYCIEGNYKFCENGIPYGFHTSSIEPYLWGAYGQYLYLCPGSKVHKIPDDISGEAAILINATVANAVQWVRIMGCASIGTAIVIQGAGPQGLSAVIAAKESGASPIIICGLTADTERFKLAKEFGADVCIDTLEQDPVQAVLRTTGGKKADLVLDVTGSPTGIVNSINMIKPGGTLVCAGITGLDKPTNIYTDKLVLNEIKFQGVFTCSFEAVEAAIGIVKSGKYAVEKIVTHRFSLEEAEKAVQLVGDQNPDARPLKAVIIP